jgi:tRNA pseudouridine55 synthase
MHDNPFEQGMVLLIDKPLRWTSFDVVRHLRHRMKIKKVGHAGTLDPLATGLLIICTGRFTKKINEYMSQEKEYTGKIMLGSTTPSYDLETMPENHSSTDHVSSDNIVEAARQLTGAIQQVPPIHSAIKKNGKRVYELARAGKSVELSPRPVEIKEFEITGFAIPEISFRVVCSTGTYIRSLAHDLGQLIGCGAHLTQLTRTRIGQFKLADAWSVEQAGEKIEAIRTQNG